MSGCRRVLIVDDEHVIADTLTIIFRNAGHDARAVYSAEQALSLLDEADWLPDLAIIDVQLPRISGVELAIYLKAERPSSRLSLFTGQAVSADLILLASAAEHRFHVLSKPAHPQMLLDLASTKPPSSED